MALTLRHYLVCGGSCAALLFANPILASEIRLTEEPVIGSSTSNIILAQNEVPPPKGKIAAASGDKKRSNRRVAIEEIVVTAQKRVESSQDVPIMLNAFSGDELDARGITDPSDFQLVTPGLVYDSIASFPIIYIRGVGTDIFIPSADPSVATYIDGVYFPFGYGLAKDLDIVERVEVLKGPQGTTFGRNTAGGAFNILTKDPSSDEPIGQIQFETARFNSYRTKAFLSGPLTETLSFGMGMVYSTSDEYYKTTSRSTDPDLQKNEDTALRLKLLWEPSDSFDLMTTFYTLESVTPSSNLWDSQEASPIGLVVGATGDGKDNYTYEGMQPFSFLQTQVATLQARYSSPQFEAKFLASHQEMDNDGNIDFDGTSTDLASFNPSDMGARINTYELQLTSTEDGLLSSILGMPFSWIAGLYYIDSNAGFYRMKLDVAQLSSFEDTSFLDPLRGLLAALNLDQTLLNPGFSVLLGGAIEVQSPAVYLHSNLDVTDWFGLTLGVRYQEEQRGTVGSYSALTNPSNSLVIPLLSFEDREIDDANISPKIGLNFTPSDSILLFASWSRGFKSATYNFLNIYTEPRLVEEEQIDSFEIGLKSEWFDGRLRANASVFQNDIDNLQVQVIALLSGGAVGLDNAGVAQIRGADWELTWGITEDLIASFNGTYLDGVYQSYPDGTGFDEGSGLYSENLDLTGNTTTRTPELSGTFSLFQTLDVGSDATLELGADVYYNSGYFQDSQNTLEQESYYQVGARASYFYVPWGIRATVFGNNLNNAKRYIFKFRNDFGAVGKLAPPADYGLRLNWDF